MIPPCPTCQACVADRLPEISRVAIVDYYRCAKCGTVWTQPKGEDGPIRIVVYPVPR